MEKVTIKNNYYLHPRTFKFCLMRAKNTRLYAKYYLLLEESIKYYHDYQIMYSDSLLKQKDDKIDQLLKETREQTLQINNLLGHTLEIKENLNDLTDFSIEQYEQREIEELKVSKILPDRINDPVTNEHLILFKLQDNKFYVIRGIQSYLSRKFKSLTNISYKDKENIKSTTNYLFLKEYRNVPNSRHLYRALQKYPSISSICANTFESSKSNEEIINIVQEVFDLRLTIQIEQEELEKVNKKAVRNIIS